MRCVRGEQHRIIGGYVNELWLAIAMEAWWQLASEPLRRTVAWANVEQLARKCM